MEHFKIYKKNLIGTNLKIKAKDYVVMELHFVTMNFVLKKFTVISKFVLKYISIIYIYINKLFFSPTPCTMSVSQ